jgi:hypothetical protein
MHRSQLLPSAASSSDQNRDCGSIGQRYRSGPKRGSNTSPENCSYFIPRASTSQPSSIPSSNCRSGPPPERIRTGFAVRIIEMRNNQRGINLASRPSGQGCVECLASPDGWWFHLRRCAECGHIGCCDSSPSQHASKHAASTGHPIIASFEPGESWFYDYGTREMIQGFELLPPHAHRKSQPTPGPSGRVPADWESLLH